MSGGENVVTIELPFPVGHSYPVNGTWISRKIAALPGVQSVEIDADQRMIFIFASKMKKVWLDRFCLQIDAIMKDEKAVFHKEQPK